MTTKININGKEVEITLTAEQVEKIKESSMKITDRVKTFEDACRIAGVSDNMAILLKYNGIDGDMIASQAHAKLTIVAKALNEGWKPDWSDKSQYKYYSWMKFTPGVGFSYLVCVVGGTHSDVGSRLCFKTSELAKYAAEQFQDIYNDLFN